MEFDGLEDVRRVAVDDIDAEIDRAPGEAPVALRRPPAVVWSPVDREYDEIGAGLAQPVDQRGEPAEIGAIAPDLPEIRPGTIWPRGKGRHGVGDRYEADLQAAGLKDRRLGGFAVVAARAGEGDAGFGKMPASVEEALVAEVEQVVVGERHAAVIAFPQGRRCRPTGSARK